MLIRRRKVTIEVEQRTLRIEMTSNAPATPVAAAEAFAGVKPAEPTEIAEAPPILPAL
jgi:hypothetical protein